jgi:hypothetical protein
MISTQLAQSCCKLNNGYNAMHGFWRTILTCLSFIQLTLAHSHKDVLTEQEAHSSVDAILWIHIVLQAAVWGVIFPIGMVLGLTRSRWHVPLQVGTDIGLCQSISQCVVL